MTEASLISWSPAGKPNKPNAAGVINDEYFDVRIFDDDDNELPRDTDGEIVIRPKRPHVMFEGYWGRPEATVGTSRNWWYHTGDIGRIDDDGYLFFVDRKADYLRRRGENISSFEVESILMSHGALADVVVHAVPSEMTEDDLKITATLKPGASLSEEELFRWSHRPAAVLRAAALHRVPHRAAPRPVGRVLKRELRDEGVTDATWDVDAVRHHLREALTPRAGVSPPSRCGRPSTAGGRSLNGDSGASTSRTRCQDVTVSRRPARQATRRSSAVWAASAVPPTAPRSGWPRGGVPRRRSPSRW